jgi:hypothetical protein
MQPDPHHILAAVMDGRDLGNGEATVAEHDHVGSQSHTSDGLPTDDLQFVPLALCQLHVHHPGDLLLSQDATFMPNF